MACRGNYTLQVAPTGYLRQWTISFTVRNKYRQVVVVTQRLIEPANPVQTSNNWSGYVLEGDHLNGAQGRFNVPNLIATSGPSATS